MTQAEEKGIRTNILSLWVRYREKKNNDGLREEILSKLETYGITEPYRFTLRRFYHTNTFKSS